MPATRSTSLPEMSAESVLKAFQGFWSPALTAHPWSRMAVEAQGAAEAAAGHWRDLAQVQMNAAGQALSASLALAAAQAEHRREALAYVMGILWPATAGALAQEREAARA